MRKAYITVANYIFELLGFIGVIISAIYIFTVSRTVKEDIAVHYDMSGNADVFGSPQEFLMLPRIMFLMLLVLVVVNHFVPAKCWNMPMKVKEVNQVLVYRAMSMMSSIMCTLSGLYTLILSINMLNENSPAMLITVLYVVALFADIIVWMVIAVKRNRI